MIRQLANWNFQDWAEVVNDSELQQRRQILAAGKKPRAEVTWETVHEGQWLIRKLDRG